MAIKDLRESGPKEQGLFIPESKMAEVEAQMRAKVLEELTESGQVLMTESELETIIVESIESFSEGKVITTKAILEEAEVALIEAAIGDDTLVSDKMLERAEKILRNSIIEEAEEAVDGILENSIGMTFDKLSDLKEDLHVIKESELSSVEDKFKEKVYEELSDELGVSVQDIKEGTVNILTDSDFEKLEEAFIEKIAESMKVTSESITEACKKKSKKNEGGSVDDTIECLVDSESYENDFDGLKTIKLIKKTLDYYKKEYKTLDLDAQEENPDGPFEDYPGIWFEDISNLDAKKVFDYLNSEYEEDMNESKDEKVVTESLMESLMGESTKCVKKIDEKVEQTGSQSLMEKLMDGDIKSTSITEDKSETSSMLDSLV
jgi:hypothetical protein